MRQFHRHALLHSLIYWPASSLRRPWERSAYLMLVNVMRHFHRHALLLSLIYWPASSLHRPGERSAYLIEGIKWAPGLFSSCTFTWLFLWYILKCKFDQNHPVPCITLVEFLPPSTPLGCGKVCIEIKEEKDCNSGGGSKWDDSGCSLRIFIKL